MREIRTLHLTWRGLETWPWWNCEPTPQSKERTWKPSTYSRRACPRPYLKTSGRGDPLAEFNRALRCGALWRKRSLGMASEKGNRWVERIFSLKETCRLQARVTYAVLVDAITRFFFGQQPDCSWSNAGVKTSSSPL